MMKKSEYCFLCSGVLVGQVGIIENVPAWVCNQCGDMLLSKREQPKKNLIVPAYEF